MWNPISIDQFVKIHLKNNQNGNEKVLKVPLCLTCIKNNSDNWDYDVLCYLNRFGQKSGEIIECGEYQKG